MTLIISGFFFKGPISLIQPQIKLKIGIIVISSFTDLRLQQDLF